MYTNIQNLGVYCDNQYNTAGCNHSPWRCVVTVGDSSLSLCGIPLLMYDLSHGSRCVYARSRSGSRDQGVATPISSLCLPSELI